MTHDTPPKRIWTRDLDGTGSQHPCWPDDEGAIAYVLVSEADAMVAAALRDLARQLLATMTERDEAQAAQAGVVERCASTGYRICAETRHVTLGRKVEDAIRSLADPTGVKLLAELRQREANLALHAANLADQLAEARKREASLRDAGERALRALKPFADRVFNDNGDCTISDQHLLTGADFTNAYQAHGKLRAALSAAPTGEESNG